MFRDVEAFSGYSINDPKAARAFYGDILGLDVRGVDGMDDFGALELHIKNSAPILLYPKPDHQPATYTVLNFPVDDIDAVVDGLKDWGVEPLRYDGGVVPQDEKGIARGLESDQGPDIAWIADPAGNVLAILQSQPRDEEAEE